MQRSLTLKVAEVTRAVPKDADPREYLPAAYHEFLDVFDRKQANKLPPHRPWDHSIDLHPGKQPPAARPYSMNQHELKALREYLDKELTKGFIRVSRSPASAPVLFVKKSNGDLRFCIDYRGLNSITIKNRYSLPLITETLSQLSRAKFYTKLDIISAFNKLRIKEGDEWKAAFTCRYGLFEPLVLPFGLCNGPASFQAYINHAGHLPGPHNLDKRHTHGSKKGGMRPGMANSSIDSRHTGFSRVCKLLSSFYSRIFAFGHSSHTLDEERSSFCLGH